MTKNEIITWLWGFDIPQHFKKVVPKRIYDDFVQYCYIELLKNDVERLQQMYNDGTLKGFFYTLCKFQAINKKSMFYATNGEISMNTKYEFVPLDYVENKENNDEENTDNDEDD